MGQQEKNKVEFGLENVYFARATTDLLSGATTYEKPIRWPGAVELSLEASGDLIKFKADNIDYYISGNNQMHFITKDMMVNSLQPLFLKNLRPKFQEKLLKVEFKQSILMQKLLLLL